MALFDYRCDVCEHDFEALIRNESDIAELTCPQCSSPKVHRLLSLPAAPLASTGSSPQPGACGVGPPCGAPWCGRKG